MTPDMVIYKKNKCDTEINSIILIQGRVSSKQDSPENGTFLINKLLFSLLQRKVTSIQLITNLHFSIGDNHMENFKILLSTTNNMRGSIKTFLKLTAPQYNEFNPLQRTKLHQTFLPLNPAIPPFLKQNTEEKLN